MRLDLSHPQSHEGTWIVMLRLLGLNDCQSRATHGHKQEPIKRILEV